MGLLFNLVFQLFLLAISAAVTIIFTAQYDYELRNSSPDFKPKLFRNGQILTFNKVPLETPYPIDNIELSIVVPAYNEELRLPIMIEQTVNYFTQMKFEIIIVNDGSTDNTWKVILELGKKYPGKEISGITYKKNAGKGYAVTTGMKYARGKLILMADADGATQIQDFEKLKHMVDSIKTDENGIIAIGSRNHLVERVVKQRAWYRNILMHINNFFVRTLIGLTDIKDTQCGFKLFTRRAAYNVFHRLHIVRWAFDVEILYIAKQFNIPIAEIPVNWREVEGSKLNVVSASISFFRDYFAILSFYSTGYWNI